MYPCLQAVRHMLNFVALTQNYCALVLSDTNTMRLGLDVHVHVLVLIISLSGIRCACACARDVTLLCCSDGRGDGVRVSRAVAAVAATGERSD